MCKSESANLRPAVLKFAQAMEDRLREHDAERGAHGWDNSDSFWLYDRLRQECRELRKELRRADGNCDVGYLARIRDEAADVANFAMMIADNAAVR
jgi:NTP pyrophosphatase (non-canonical NTP hydrolase)